MKILTEWLRSYLPVLDVDDAQLAEDLTLRGIAVEGIFELNDPAGNSAASLFDMDITTNRVDAMNHFGIAREVAAIYNLPLHPLDTSLPAPTPADPLPIRTDPSAEALCGRFTAQVIRDVRIAPSEGRIARFFTALGQKQISNAVDISNFVLLGMGHPTHAFDLDKIQGGILIRRALLGEQLRLLDGSTRTLTPDDLVIADHSRAISLAGIMGGYDTMITAATRNILVESAWFSPAAIRASSRRHLIHTDASHRFERGADFAAAPLANRLVSRHILDACGGHLDGPLQDLILPEHQAVTSTRPPIQLSVTHTQRLLGTTLDPAGIDSALIAQYLTALGCTLTLLDPESNPDTFEVCLPSWRLDLTRPIDLIEEVARVYGYNRFANTLPAPGIVLAHPSARAHRAIRDRLYALGFSEALSTTFASAPDSTLFAPPVPDPAPAVPLENPLSEEAALLRPSLLPGMVAMLAGNLNRDVPAARLFEAGEIFTGSTAAVHETASLALGIFGPSAQQTFHPAEDAPFFELKGAIEALLTLFEAPAADFVPLPASLIFEPGRAATATLNGHPLARFGELSRTEAARRKLRQPIFLAELDLAHLLQLPLRQPSAHELSRFQAVERDFSFTFPDAILWQQIHAAIRALNLPELRTLHPIEIWRDRKKYPGVYSTLIRTVFQSNDRTLVDIELTAWSSAIITALEALGGTLRT